MAGENLGQILDEVVNIIQDDSFRDAGTNASGTMTISALPSLAETFVVNDTTFTFVTTRADSGEVTLGASVSACCTNIAAAINLDLGTDFTASATSSTVVVTANYPGEAWNQVVFSNSTGNMTMTGSGYLSGGAYGGGGIKIINRAIEYISNRVLLPALATTADVTTSTSLAYVALPATFQRNLSAVYDSTNGLDVDIYDSRVALLADAGSSRGTDGMVFGVAPEGDGYLYYEYVPSTAITMSLTFHRKPDALVYMTDVPTCIPSQHIFPLVVHKAAQLAFDTIENGPEDQKVDTMRQEQIFEKNMVSLIGYLNSFTKTTATVRQKTGWI